MVYLVDGKLHPGHKDNIAADGSYVRQPTVFNGVIAEVRACMPRQLAVCTCSVASLCLVALPVLIVAVLLLATYALVDLLRTAGVAVSLFPVARYCAPCY